MKWVGRNGDAPVAENYIVSTGNALTAEMPKRLKRVLDHDGNGMDF